MLATHLVLSVGWIGAAVGYLCLGVTAEVTRDAELVRASWLAMDLVGWMVIVPLAVGSLITGVLMAVGTVWGLFRHYWVLFSLVLTTFATLVLVLHMPTVSSHADVARFPDASRLETLGGDVGHPAIGLLVLLSIQVLNVFKPRGLTGYGQRKRHGAAPVAHQAAPAR